MIDKNSTNEALSWSLTDQMDATSDSSVLCEVQLLSSSQLQEIYNSYFLNIENCFEGTHKLQESCIQSPTFHKLVARDFSEHYVASKNRSLIRRNHYWWGNAGNTINYRKC